MTEVKISNYKMNVFFNENGKYINTIGNKGMGPGEFSSYPRCVFRSKVPSHSGAKSPPIPFESPT